MDGKLIFNSVFASIINLSLFKTTIDIKNLHIANTVSQNKRLEVRRSTAAGAK